MHQLSLFASGDGGGGGGGMIQLLVLLLIPVAMYMLLIRPQRRRMKDQASMQSDLGIGDEVITSAGIYGFITGEEEDRFWLEIDDDVQIRIAKAAIQGKVTTSDEPDTSDADAADDDDGDDGVGEDDGVADAADGDRTDADDS